MKTILKIICLLLALALLCGCADFAAPGRDTDGAGESSAPVGANSTRFSSRRCSRGSSHVHSTAAEQPAPEPPACMSCRARS